MVIFSIKLLTLGFQSLELVFLGFDPLYCCAHALHSCVLVLVVSEELAAGDGFSPVNLRKASYVWADKTYT